jgi:hypothetical protein
VNLTSKIEGVAKLLTVDESILRQNSIYQIKPTNFENLAEGKQRRELAKFFSILRAVTKPVRIIMLKEPVSVGFGSETTEMFVERTFLQTSEPVDGVLGNTGSEYSIVTSSPVPKVAREEITHLVFEDGSVGKWFALYKMPSTLPAAWIHTLLPHVDMVSIFFSPVQNHIAVGMMARTSGLLAATAQRSIESRQKYENAIALRDALSRSDTAMYTCSVNVLIRGANLPELKNRVKTARTVFRQMMSSFEPTATIQKKINDSGIGKKLHFELGSCSVFYPFVSADMLEMPNGIPIGKNLDTGAPVIYDYTMRTNTNMVFLASSGAGKSVTMKTIIARLVEKYPNSHVFIVDPHGEYGGLGKHMGIPVVNITESTDLGFDPFRLFENKEDAADMVSEISKATDLVRKAFRSVASECNSIKDLYDKVDDEGKKYLVDLVSGFTEKILAGESKLGDKVILSMKGTTGDERTSMLLLFALGRLWKEIQTLPVSVPKILVIDEGWLLFRMSSAGKFLELVARAGRKYNVIFMFATQQPEDVLEDRYGRAIADNSDTKFILGNTEKATQKIKESLDLSDQEAGMLPAMHRGQALLLTKDHRLRVQITPSKKELEIFSTTPGSAMP